LEKIEYGLVFKALKNFNEAKKNQGAFLFFFSFFVFSFLTFFFLSLFSFFPSFFSSIYF
jgi:hypothetical protein